MPKNEIAVIMVSDTSNVITLLFLKNELLLSLEWLLLTRKL